MRSSQKNSNYLYEGLENFSTARSMMLWESAGIQIREAALTADQIQQIFAAAEQGATDAGGNRTMLGKGKDAAEAVNKAWEDLKTKIQNSAPIAAVDQKYDDVVGKIEAGLGGPDNAVNQVIQKYRAFAKEHPIAQGFIYSALIAAAGISGACLGGAAVLSLLKKADKLLQGEKFSSAAYSGAKTGAAAYAAGQIGKAMRGDQPAPDAAAADTTATPDAAPDVAATTPTDAAQGATTTAANVTGNLNPRSISNNALAIFKEKVANGEVTDYNSYQNAMHDAVTQAASAGGKSASYQAQSMAQRILDTKLGGVAAQASGGQFSGSGPEKVAAVIKALGGTPDPEKMQASINAAAEMRRAMGNESRVIRGRKLSEGQVYMIFNRVTAQVVMEGPGWDQFKAGVKQAVGGAVKGAQTVGHNLTTKVTADKLNKAWAAAGSPMDSAEVAKILTANGVDKSVVTKVYADLNLPTGKDSKTTTISIDQVMAMVNKLPTDRKLRLLKYLSKQTPKAEPAAAKPQPDALGRIEPTM